MFGFRNGRKDLRLAAAAAADVANPAVSASDGGYYNSVGEHQSYCNDKQYVFHGYFLLVFGLRDSIRELLFIGPESWYSDQLDDPRLKTNSTNPSTSQAQCGHVGLTPAQTKMQAKAPAALSAL